MNSILPFVVLSCCLALAAAGAVGNDPITRPTASLLPKKDDPGDACSYAPFESIRNQFNKDGYVVLRDFFSEQQQEENVGESSSSSSSSSSLLPLLRDDWRAFSTVYWDRIFRVLHERGHISQPKHLMTQEYIMGKLRKPGYKEIVHRFPGRYELSLNEIVVKDGEKKQSSSSAVDAEIQSLYQDMPDLEPIIEKLEPVILSILRQHPDYKEGPQGEKYNLLRSMLISAPGSQNQQFHFDTRHLHPDIHYPAHIINVFIPLVDILTEELGPTEIMPASHWQTRLLQNPAKRDEAKPMHLWPPAVKPMLKLGDVLMFDFRILHRGIGNTAHMNRPLLVLAFSIPSFHDTANWPGPSIFE